MANSKIPKGLNENSPPFQRWVKGNTKSHHLFGGDEIGNRFNGLRDLTTDQHLSLLGAFPSRRTFFDQTRMPEHPWEKLPTGNRHLS
ncbi:hypothetical protein [Caldithrix abyssi]|uniref:Uncharacterized protein n=1 Tax=Caldithrix abyssi DSM 13497 TaxID=880073 RepID=A0A1J1C2K9_CALAY|nr:hypothetical protein [Caldithrix abyssi]APF16925.1 hypothetical protein Cabys_174 [Caldithrix abyssi DSM 13497]